VNKILENLAYHLAFMAITWQFFVNIVANYLYCVVTFPDIVWITAMKKHYTFITGINCDYRNDADLLCIMLRFSKWCWFIVHHAAIIEMMLICCVSCCDYQKDAVLLCIMLRLSKWCCFIVYHAAIIKKMLICTAQS